ncbi:melanocyte-stimulating hormone receptor-like [Montipora foliosa]|uniref:melanocyte-stimulating hormone receptor-like n=1 Tax=Montipora foliosa TaxID=591990 RepID=UPI0035F121CC
MPNQTCIEFLRIVRLLVQCYRSTLFSLNVLHFVFPSVATFGNILAIRALWKASSLPPNLRKMFLSLALSDLAVGLFAHLMIAVLYKIVLSNEDYNLDVLCPVPLIFCNVILYLLTSASFLNVTAIAVDRLLAVSLHLRYQELVTSKRVTIALVVIWLASIVTASVSATTLQLYAAAVLRSMGFILTTVAYIRVYKVARYHRIQLQNQFQRQNSQATVLLRERKSALNAVYIYIVFLVCYLPNYFCLLFLATNNWRGSTLVAYEVTLFVVLLNSSVNPLVYCWRYPEVRRIMKSTLKKIFRVPEE